MIIHKSQNPLHLQLYNFADTTGRIDTNFCLYSRKVAYGVFWASFVVLVGVAAGLLVIEPMMATIMWAFSDYPFQTFFNPQWALFIWLFDSIAALIAIVIGSITLIHEGWKKLRDRPGTYVPPKEPGFIRTWIKSVHDKTCFTIEIRD